MCLGLLCQLLELRPGGTALASHDGRTIGVSMLTLVEPAEPGDWLLVHSGYALARLTPDQAAQARTTRGTGTEGTA